MGDLRRISDEEIKKLAKFLNVSYRSLKAEISFRLVK